MTMTTIGERVGQQADRAWPMQALRFLAVGLLNTAVDAGLYLALTRALGLGALPALAKGISYSAGVLNSFYWNRSWTFRSEAKASRALLPFALASLVALALNAGTVHLALHALHLPEALAFLAATGVAFLWNFAISRFVIFRE
jgi:putative flippase GtrA